MFPFLLPVLSAEFCLGSLVLVGPGGCIWISLVVGFLSIVPLARAAPPAGYYDSVVTSSSVVLRTTLHEVIDDHQRFPYTSTAIDTWYILDWADENPADATAILDVYKNTSFPKFGGGGGGYNREHTWPSSYGFPNDNSQNYPYSDCHHLFLSDQGYNSSRGNNIYSECNAACAERPTAFNGGVGGGTGVYPGQSNWRSADGWETWIGRRGDVARALFYLDTRYEGGVHGTTGFSEPDLILTDDVNLITTTGANASTAYMGLLSVLIQWHLQDPVDAAEQARNDRIHSYQQNRNPFIDHPAWVTCLYSGVCDSSGVPARPAGLTASLGFLGIELDWNDNFESDLDGYRVERAVTPGGGSMPIHPGLLTVSEFTDTSVIPNKSYYYTVRAVDLDGDVSPPSDEVTTPGPSPFINEIHYDNAGTDQFEGFEIAGAAGTDLTGWQVVTYNGNGGTATATLNLSGVLADDGSGFGFLFFFQAGLQNGPADGLALVNSSGEVVEFLSYEGALLATNGVASGMTATDITVSESSSTASDHSLQRQGIGSAAEDFSWAAPTTQTRGLVNSGQSMVVATAVPMLSNPALALLALTLLGASGFAISRGNRIRSLD